VKDPEERLARKVLQSGFLTTSWMLTNLGACWNHPVNVNFALKVKRLLFVYLVNTNLIKNYNFL
jgi:hypothetical protein